jgi:heme/copper-type cytochrome/quinol oxidase subunit 2
MTYQPSDPYRQPVHAAPVHTPQRRERDGGSAAAWAIAAVVALVAILAVVFMVVSRDQAISQQDLVNVAEQARMQGAMEGAQAAANTAQAAADRTTAEAAEAAAQARAAAEEARAATVEVVTPDAAPAPADVSDEPLR